MTDITDEMQDYLEREKIRDCIVRLARGEDRRDPDALRATFAPDATIDMGVFVGSFDEYFEWVIPGAAEIPVTQHILGQSLIERDGDTALTETHVTSYHRVDMGDQHRDTVVSGRYLDRLEKRDGDWRIAGRTLLYDWFQDFGESVDWSQGVMGLPFKGDHCTGSAVGDYSEIFFGKRPGGKAE